MPLDLEKVDLGGFGVNVDQNDTLRSNMDEAFKINPDEHARNKKLSSDSGVPQFAVESDPADVEHSLKLDQINFPSLTSETPATGQFLSNFDNAVVAQDDVDGMAFMENVLKSINPLNFVPNKESLDLEKTFSDVGASAKLSFQSQGLGARAAAADRLSGRIEDLIPASALPMGMEFQAADLSVAMAKQMGIENDEQLQQAKEESVDGLITQIRGINEERKALTPEDLNTVEQGVRGGVESLINMAPGFALMVATGGRAAPLLTTIGVQTYGDAYGGARAEGLSPETANWKASIDAGIEVGTEVLPTGTLSRLLTGGAKDNMTKAAMKFLVQEMGTEQLATLGQTANDFAFGLDEQLENATSVEEMVNIQLQRQAVTAIATIVAGGAQVTAATAVRKTVQAVTQQEQQTQTRSDIEQQGIDQINDTASESKLRARDPEAYKQFMQEADSTGNTNVFIDGVQASLYLQSKTQDEIAADPALTLIAEQVGEAAALGGDVVIPVAEFATEVAGTAHYEALRESMTLSAETTSPFRQEQVQQDTQNYVAGLVEEAQENVSSFVEAQEIFTSVRDQLVDSGSVTPANASVMAQIVPAWATVYAKQNGISVQEAYQASGLVIEGPQTGEKARLSEDALSQGTVYDSETPNYPLAPRGEWHGDADFAARGGKVVMMNPQEYIDSVRPLTRDDETLENVEDLRNHIEEGRQLDPLTIYETGQEDGRHRALAAIDLGIDQVPVLLFGEQIERFSDAQPFADYQGLLAQVPVEPKNLVVTHNLSSENILAAADLGGLAAPSIATIRSDVSNFDNFGEVSLLADPSLLESAKARTFDADIYSPRQPRPTYDINESKFREFASQLDVDNVGLSQPDINSLADSSGADSLQRSTAVQYLWLQEQGKSPKLKNRKVEPTVKKGAKFAEESGETGTTLARNPEFQKLAKQHYTKLLAKVAAKDEGRVERYSGFWFDENGDLLTKAIINFKDEVDRVNREGGVDTHQLRNDIDKKMRVKKTRDAYDLWVTDKFNEMVDGKKIFKGFTPSGNRKYSDYNMQNVVKEMTQQLQAGESSFYGAGTVRSKFANEMKTIKQVQAKRGDIVSEGDMTIIKEESADVFTQALDDLKPFYKFDADSWGYGEDAGTAIMEGRKGLNEAFDMTPEAQKIVNDLVNYLVALPSSYFETKIQRAVSFSEFNTAVVPRGMRKDALQVLKDAGLKIKTYDASGVGKTRQDVIAEQQKLLFQKTPTSKEARGFYDPANSTIRMTEAADLSTFLHEFAHFMYEMEKSAGGETQQSINNWYKRNATNVAAEANGYLGKQGDLEQDSVNLDVSHKARMERAEAMGFDTSTVYYHGTDVDFASFNPNKAGEFSSPDTDGVITLTPDPTIASRYAKANTNTVYFNKQAYDEEIGRNVVEPSNPQVMPVFLTKNIKKVDVSGKQHNSRIMIDEQNKAKNDGFDGVQFIGLMDDTYYNPSGGLADTVQVFDPANIRSINATFDPSESESSLLLAQSTGAPTGSTGAITADDVVAFLDEGTSGDTNKDAAINVAVHEQFARGFETYLMEGKAPSIELRNAFRTFARWLTQIYASLRGNLNVNLDQEMRQVFDRMLATEEQIAAADARARHEPMFTDAAMAGMTEAEFADYQTRQQKVKDKSVETLRDKLIAELTRTTQKWWKDEKQDVIDEEVDRLQTERVYVTRERLRNGDVKLDLATTKQMVGEEKTDKLNRKSIRVPAPLTGMTAAGGKGVHPDQAAAFFGYNSGDEMLADLTAAPKLKDKADSNAEAVMVERHGDIMNDGTIEAQADDAVQSEERGKLLLHELKIVARGTNQPALERGVIKALAEENIGKLAFRNIHPGKYRKAEIKAAQEAAAALATGDKDTAARAKARQVMNYYLGLAATEARTGTVKIVDNMNRYNKKKVREEIMKVGNEYWEQLARILERFEFRKGATLKQVEQSNTNINTWMADRVTEHGDGLILTPAVLNESYITHWKNIPFSALQGINDSVRNIEHVARYTNKINLLEEKVEFKKVVADWVDHMNEQPDVFKAQRTTTTENRNWIRAGMAQMTKIPFMASWLDGGERVGMSHDILMDPLNVAYAEEQKLWKKTGDVVMNAIEGRSKDDRARHMRTLFIPEIQDAENDGNLNGGQVLAVALNTGNAGNLRKMLLGEGWADAEVEGSVSFDNPQLQAVLKHMTKSDWDLVQLVWDQMDLLYPQLAEVHRKTTGLTAPKVEATSVETEFGTFKGGYYPAVYDSNRSARAAINQDRADAQVESMFGGTMSLQASINVGSTNERTGFYGPIDFNLDVVSNHFQETIHYITHHDAVRQINKLINNTSVRETITKKLGKEEYNQLRPWLNDVAKDGKAAPPKTFIDAAFGRLRMGVTLGIMGFKASTGIIQVSGIFNTYAEVGSKHVHKAMRTVYGRGISSIRDAQDFAFEHSNIMENRMNTMDREIKNAMSNLKGKRGVLPAVQEASMKHIALIQFYSADILSWHAGYTSELERSGDLQKAYRHADWVVENIQGSGNAKDMATVFRNQSKTHTTFTMFMTFFSSLWNMERDLVRGARSGKYSLTTTTAKVMFLFTLPVLFEAMMRGELDDDDDAVIQKTLTKLALYPVSSVPFVRDIASGVGSSYGYNSSPVASTIEQGLQGVVGLTDSLLTDDDIRKSSVKSTSKLAGAALQLPGVSQAWATGEHLYDVIEEGEELSVHQLLFGPKKD